MQQPEITWSEDDAESLRIVQALRTGKHTPEWIKAMEPRNGKPRTVSAPRKGGTIQPKARKKGKKR